MRKIKKQTKNNKKGLKFDAEVLFYFFIMAILPVFIAAFYVQYERIDDLTGNTYLIENVDKIFIKTDKSVYQLGGKIILAIENYTDRSIYSQPCEYLDNFEKYINGEWVNLGIRHENVEYDRSGFNLSKKTTKCALSIPEKEGEGVYRFVVKVYHGCQEPENCIGAIDFYSNEFRVEESAFQKVSSN